MSNTQRKQAKRKAQQKAKRGEQANGRHVHGPSCVNVAASMWAAEAAGKAGLSEFDQKIAFMVGMRMTPDTWEMTVARDELVADLAKFGGASVDEVEKALTALEDSGLLSV